jgi:hypothetical protein
MYYRGEVSLRFSPQFIDPALLDYSKYLKLALAPGTIISFRMLEH